MNPAEFVAKWKRNELRERQFWDEVEALARKAEKERTSKSEIIRRALRAYLGVED